MAGELQEAPVGHWFYYKKIYQGKEMPEPPHATLRLYYEFRADGTSRLYWWHEGENDLCDREGRYTIEGNVIVEKTTKVDPNNHPSCSRDPDMQEGKTTRIPFRMKSDGLHLYLPFSDDFLIYVWRNVSISEDLKSGETE